MGIVAYATAIEEHFRTKERPCIDGRLGLDDIAKAAGLPVRATRRAMNAIVAASDDHAQTDTGAVFAFDNETVPAPESKTRAELALIVARKLKLGRFRDRPVAVPPAPRERKAMSRRGHPWRDEIKGRSIRSESFGHHLAVLTCACGNSHDIRFRELAGADQIDQKFKQAGWRLDPAKCPSCITPIKMKEPTMGEPNGAVKAQAKLFRLLGVHFDGDTGVYAEGWSDAKMATETGLAPGVVKTFRDEAFGALKEPPEFAALSADIHAVDQLIKAALNDTIKPLQDEVEKLKGRLVDLRRKWPQN